MLRRLTRWAAVPVSTLALGALSIAGAPAANAVGTCFLPLPLAGVGAGAFSSPADYDAWRYPAGGTTTISLLGSNVWMRVYSGTNCSTLLCSSTYTCTVTATGPITVQVGAVEFGGAYVVSAATTALQAAPCTQVDAGGVCIGLAAGAVRDEEIVYGVTAVPGTSHPVGGWVDAYRFPLPTGGSAVVPCVVLAVDTRNANPCATAGGTFVERRLTLFSQSVQQRQVVPGSPVLRVRVCDATFTATVNGFGLESIPVYTTC